MRNSSSSVWQLNLLFGCNKCVRWICCVSVRRLKANVCERACSCASACLLLGPWHVCSLRDVDCWLPVGGCHPNTSSRTMQAEFTMINGTVETNDSKVTVIFSWGTLDDWTCCYLSWRSGLSGWDWGSELWLLDRPQSLRPPGQHPNQLQGTQTGDSRKFLKWSFKHFSFCISK